MGPLLIVHRGYVVLGPVVRGAAIGQPRLEAGEVPVLDDGGSAEHGYFAASRVVDPSRLAAAQRAWVGRELRLGGPNLTCTGRVTGLRVIAEVRGLDDGMIAAGDNAAALAAAIISRGKRALAAEVDAPCVALAAWAMPAASRRPIAWTADHGHLTGPPGTTPLDLEIYGDGCPERASFRLAGGNRELWTGVYQPVDVRDVLDLAGDGWPTVVLHDGWLERDPPTGRYRRVTALAIAPDWYACIE